MNLQSILAYSIASAAAIIFIYLSALANIDLIDGRHSLFMDERISYDQVAKIFDSGSISGLFQSIYLGDQRYGRTTFYIPAIFVWVTQNLADESGSIFAVRMTHSFAMLIAFVFLTFGQIQNKILASIAFVFILTFPFTTYYTSTPKPEPLQLLFLSIFLYLLVHKASQTWSWIFLGLAFGTKISIVVIIPVIVCYYMLSSTKRAVKIYEFKKLFSESAQRFGWFMLGFLLAVPIILTRSNGFSRFFHSTFANTGHGADSDDINLLSWINFLPKALDTREIVALYFLVCIIILICLIVVANDYFKDMENYTVQVNKKQFWSACLFTICGICWLLAILIGVKRLWGFYLFPGFILLSVGLFLWIEFLFKLKTWQLSLAMILCAGLLIVCSSVWSKHRISEFRVLASRTKTEIHRVQSEKYNAMMRFLEQKHQDEQLFIYVRPKLYLPSSSDKWIVKEIWGPFRAWDKTPDYIFNLEESLQRREVEVTDGDKATNIALAVQDLHVTNSSDVECDNEPCYLIQHLTHDLIVLEKIY